jgi:hypothetical protein
MTAAAELPLFINQNQNQAGAMRMRWITSSRSWAVQLPHVYVLQLAVQLSTRARAQSLLEFIHDS